MQFGAKIGMFYQNPSEKHITCELPIPYSQLNRLQKNF